MQPPSGPDGQGADPYARLIAAVQSAQSQDPFARVTVVVPHPAVAYDVTRRLSRAAERGGVVHVRAVTLTGLAEQIVTESAALAHRERLTPGTLRAALAAELDADPLLFAGVAQEPATLDAVTGAAMRMLRAEHPDAPCPPVTAAMRTLQRRALARLGSPATLGDVLGAARRLLKDDPAIRARLGAVICFQLPAQHDPAGRGFLEALADGAAVIEAPSVSAIEARARIDELISVTDPHEEARAAVEIIAAALASGTLSAGNRAGIFFPAADPYQGLVTAQLEQAGIAYTARGAAPLAASPAARTLLALLRLDPADPDLHAVLDGRWSGVLRGPSEAHPEAPLGPLPPSPTLERAFVQGMDPDHELRGADRSGGAAGRLEESFAQLTAWTEALCARLRAMDAAATVDDALDVLEELIAAALRPASRRGGSGGHASPEQQAHAALRHAVAALRARGAEAFPGREMLVGHLAAELSALTPRIGTLREGVMVGTLASAVARDLDLVIICGMAEGIAPAPSAIDPLIPPEAAEALGGALLPDRIRRQEQEQELRGAIAAGRRVIVTTPRGRLREAGPLQLSPWIGPAARRDEHDERVRISSDPQLDAVSRVIASPVAGSRDGYGPRALATTLDAAWQRRLLASQEAASPDAASLEAGPSDDPGRGEPLPARVLHARRIRADRRDGRFTRFTGDLSGLTSLDRVDLLEAHDGNPRVTSASALETWASDPFVYLLERVLGAELFEYPDEQDRADAKRRGTIVHAALESVVLAQIAAGGAVPEDAEIRALVDEALDRFASDRWVQALWQGQRTETHRIIAEQTAALRADAQAGIIPLAAESAFGIRRDEDADGLAPLVIAVDGGRLHVRGVADRVDLMADGSLRVIDYKTGSAHPYHSAIISEPGGRRTHGRERPFDPTGRGTRLQLPLYALHALRDHRPQAPSVRVEYRFVAGAERPPTVGFTWSPLIEAEFTAQLSRIVTAIRSGLFPTAFQATGHGARRLTWAGRMGERDQVRLAQNLAAVPRVRTALGQDARPDTATGPDAGFETGADDV